MRLDSPPNPPSHHGDSVPVRCPWIGHVGAGALVVTTPAVFGDTRLPPHFWSKVHVLENGCWQWTASLVQGYGQFVRARPRGAHRWAYEHLIGPVPDGLEPDHLCRNKGCVNPSHLEPVTHRENMLRGNTVPARYARQTHCLRGHPFDEANTYHPPSSRKRVCRECRGIRSRAQYYRRKGALL